jgi:Ohr subfamily peroxiredoxin
MQCGPDAIYGGVRYAATMKTIQVASMMADGGRQGSVAAPDGDFRVAFSPDGGSHLSPEHLFAGAYAASFYDALDHAAERTHQEVPGLSVIANVALERDDHRGSSLAVELRAAMPGVARRDAEHLLHLAHETCPFSKAMRGRVEVNLTLD